MKVDIDRGCLLYERSRNGRGLILRQYRTNNLEARNAALEALTWAKKHKQPMMEFILLDIETGALEIMTEEDIDDGK